MLTVFFCHRCFCIAHACAACGALVTAAVRAFGGLCILIDDLHFCDYGSLDALLGILDGKSFPPPAVSLVMATRPSQYYPAVG